MNHDRIATSICQTVAEIPDRSSPDDQPDMMLVTADELITIVLCALENEAEIEPSGGGLLDIETMPMWAVGVVTDGVNAAVSQKAESDFDGHYFAVDPEDALEWEPTHWAPLAGEAA